MMGIVMKPERLMRCCLMVGMVFASVGVSQAEEGAKSATDFASANRVHGAYVVKPENNATDAPPSLVQSENGPSVSIRMARVRILQAPPPLRGPR